MSRKNSRKVPSGRLWVVSELYYPEQTSTGYFLTRIAEGLAPDFEVHAVAGQPSYSERGIKAPRYELHNRVQIHRLLSTRFDKDRLVGRAINFITFSFSLLLFSMRNISAGDRVLVVTNPPLAPAIVGAVGKLKAARTFLLVHDIYPDILAATGMLSPASPLYRTLDRFFARSLRLFDRIIVLGRDMQQVISKKVAPSEIPVNIIPNWADLEEIRPVPTDENPFRRELGLADRFVVQFSGNIGRSHDVELILDAAKLLAEDPRFIFMFVGFGGKTALVSDAVENGGNVLFLPRQPREKLAQMLASSDLTVISFVDGMLGLSVPSRMYNVMSSGTPVLASAHPQSELSLVVDEARAGWVLKERTPRALADLLRDIRSSGDAARRGANARQHVEANYSLDRIINSYRAVLG